MSLIEKLRPLIDLDTPLRDIPEEWMRYIEPRIHRDDKGHWHWQGSVDIDGEPIMYFRNPATDRRNTQRVKRVVAKMFYKMKPRYDVLHFCGVVDCVNPSHLNVTATHWKQR